MLSCKQPIKDIIIDNPSSESIELLFNEQRKIEVPPNSKFPISIKFGKISIRINQGNIIKLHLDEDKDYVINPSLSQYYIENIVYSLSARGKEKYQSDYGQIKSKIGNIEVNGDFTKLDPTILMEKTWLFDLDQEPSAVVGIEINPKRGYKTCKRIVRESDIFDQLTNSLIEELNIKIKED